MAQPTLEASALAGHKLVLLSPFALPDDCTLNLKKAYPGLEVVARHQPWDKRTTDLPAEEWKDATILATGTVLPDASRGELAPKLQYVQLFSAGANHLAKHAVFQDKKVAFCGANGVHGPQIAEWVIATYLSARHSLPKYREYQQKGHWGRDDYSLEESVDDSVERCVGILGYGAIGRQVARLARALGMTVHAYTLNPRTTAESRRDEAYQPHGLGDPDGELPDRWYSGTSRLDVHEFLGSGLDLLVVALPLTDLTRGLIGVDELAILGRGRPNFYLSNIARGAVIDTDALIEALNEERIAGAALDVTEPEPLPSGHPLWSAKNVTITPHISGTSTRYLARVMDILSLNLARIQDGSTPLLNQLNKTAGY